MVFSSFLLFFSGGPGGLSPPEGRFPPPAPDMASITARDHAERSIFPLIQELIIPISHSFDSSH